MNGKSISFLVLGALALVVLYFGFKPGAEKKSVPQVEFSAELEPVFSTPAAVPDLDSQMAEPGVDEASSPPAIESPAEDAVLEVDIEVQHGKRVKGPGLIKVQQGQAVSLRVLSDHDDELHLHGYDLHLQLLAGKAGALEFRASTAGRFAFELHHAHAEIGVIEVHPNY